MAIGPTNAEINSAVNITKDFKTLTGRNYPILGVKFNGSNPVGVYTDDSEGFVAEVATNLDGTKADGQKARNDFDNVYPFNSIKEVDNAGRAMIQIPKFYMWCSFDFTYIKISGEPFIGSWVHPAFLKPDNTEAEYIQIGKYHTSSNNACVSGVVPQANQTRKFFRDNARAIGAGWVDMDIHTLQLYWVLWLIVTKDRNSDHFMSGNISGKLVNTGGIVGAVSSLAQIGKTHQSFYGIENMYSNLYTFIDGINFNNEQIYTCNDFSKYADDTSSNYTNVGTRPVANGYILSMKKLRDGTIFADSVAASSATTYWCDYYYQINGWKILRGGRDWGAGGYDGPFSLNSGGVSSWAHLSIGSRLVYRP